MSSAESSSLVHRYERKYLTEDYSVRDLETRVLLHRQVFHWLYEPRQVFSLYFDTPEFAYYQLNAIGSQQRAKVRVRWYVQGGRVSPLQLELKQKNGELSTKRTWPWETRWSETNVPEVTKQVQKGLFEILPEAWRLEPKLVNSYQRSYYFSANSQIRVTLDGNLHFALPTEWERGVILPTSRATILECKYETQQDRYLQEFIEGFPLRITKSSKFVMGVQQCYEGAF